MLFTVIFANDCPAHIPYRFPGNNRCFEKGSPNWGGKMCNINPAADPFAWQRADKSCCPNAIPHRFAGNNRCFEKNNPWGGKMCNVNPAQDPLSWQKADKACTYGGCPPGFFTRESAIQVTCDPANGSVEVDLKEGETTKIIAIPQGAKNVKIEISANGDLDLCLRDDFHNKCNKDDHDCVAGFSCDVIGGDGGTKDYDRMTLWFSGDDVSTPVKESIKVTGTTSKTIYLDVIAYATTTGTVTYSWDGIENCDPALPPSCIACPEYANCPGGQAPTCDGSSTVTCSTAAANACAAKAQGTAFTQASAQHLTWAAYKNACVGIGQKLCTYEQLCPCGAGKPAIGKQSSFFAIDDHVSGNWISSGLRAGDIQCQKHTTSCANADPQTKASWCAPTGIPLWGNAWNGATALYCCPAAGRREEDDNILEVIPASQLAAHWKEALLLIVVLLGVSAFAAKALCKKELTHQADAPKADMLSKNTLSTKQQEDASAKC